MPGLSPKLPLSIDDVDGFATNKNFIEVARQNLKMIILTIPGERIMIPSFGVGIKQYLFDNPSAFLFDTIRENIKQQVAVYAPYIKLGTIRFTQQTTEFDTLEFTPSSNTNFVGIIITYSVPSAFISDTLVLEI